MKVLLIVPPALNTITTALPSIIEEEKGVNPHLGLMYIASYLEKYTNYDVEIFDAVVERVKNFKEIKNLILEKNPDVVGITAMTFTWIDVIKTARAVKEANKNIKIVLGGPHVNIYPTETVSVHEVDFVVLGEGEAPMKDLLDNINDEEALKKIRGIVFKDFGGMVINTGSRELITNLDSIPFPARHLTKWNKYYSVLAAVSPVTTMFTSRGCPYKCLFCDRPHLGKIFRARSAKNVVDEMEECERMGIKEIFIYDDTFAIDRNRVIDICNEKKRRGLTIGWDVRTRINTVDEQMLCAMKKAGCRRIHYGVESGTQRILNILKKGITIEEVEKIFKITKKAGIETLGYFMIGSPSETKEEVLETVKMAKRLDPDYVHIAVLMPYPATAVYFKGLSENILPNDYWRKFAENPTSDFVPYVWEEILTKDELVQLLKNAYRSFYFRPYYIFKRLFKLRSFGEFKRKVKAGLRMLRV